MVEQGRVMGFRGHRWAQPSPRGISTMSMARAVEPLLVALVFCAVFAVHARWVFTHFSGDGYLCDSGWLAYLFESADPLLHNPLSVTTCSMTSGVDGLSFYAHHLSPHIFLFGAPLARLFGLSGFAILALHQGLFFALFWVSLYLVVAAARLPTRYKIVAALSAILIGTLSNVLFQAAAYPHYEIAMFAVSCLAIASYLSAHRRLFAFCLLWLPLIREDGGFYVAFTCLVCIAVECRPDLRLDPRARRLAMFAVTGLVLSAGAFALKARFFPGFDAFAFNFSGGSWDHLTVALFVERLRAIIGNGNAAPVLLGCLLLLAFDIRYASGFILLSPLYLLHLLSVRPEHGAFTLYYALPWLLPPVIWLAVFVRRAKGSTASAAESALILGLSLALAAPVQAAAGTKGQFWYVAQWALSRPVTNIQSMKEFALWVRNSYSKDGRTSVSAGKQCVSMGIAALIPNEIHPDELLRGDSDVSACGTLVLLHGDMEYGVLRARAEAHKFDRVAARHNAELWVIDTN